MGIRLKTKTLELDGRIFELCCNFNVIADIEELYGGLGNLLRSERGMSSTRTILACMMNDYADRMGWDIKYTPKDVGRLLGASPAAIRKVSADVRELLLDAIAAPDADSPSQMEAAGEDTGKN